MVELAVPAIIMLLLGAIIKAGADLDKFPAEVPTSDTPVFTYGDMQNIPTYPSALCFDDDMFLREWNIHGI